MFGDRSGGRSQTVSYYTKWYRVRELSPRLIPPIAGHKGACHTDSGENSSKVMSGFTRRRDTSSHCRGSMEAGTFTLLMHGHQW